MTIGLDLKAAAEEATAKAAIVSMVGSAFMPGTAAASEPEPASTEKVKPFDFDADFQTKIAALTIRDNGFVRQVGHILRPEYFENVGEAIMVDIALTHYRKYGAIPDMLTYNTLLKERMSKGRLKGENATATVAAYKRLRGLALNDGVFAAEKVCDFVRHQATANAVLQSADLLNKPLPNKFAKIENLIKEAVSIALNADGDEYDYYAEIANRTEERLDKASGKLPPTGITTGVHKLDEKLYHKGWGRKELAVLMGGAKSGKTTALLNFAKFASLKGFNVLYVTLEVASRIIAERLDACITDNNVKDLDKLIHDVRTKIEALQKKTLGNLKIREFPTGTLTPGALERLLEQYRDKGVLFDLIVIDYADLMAPEHRINDPIENSKSVYVDLRAVMQKWNAAGLTATQTNREGFKALIAKAEHVAEDFNRIRIADLVISINVTDEERAKGEARLYFAASRNQESGFTLRIRQEISKMKFIAEVLGEE